MSVAEVELKKLALAILPDVSEFPYETAVFQHCWWEHLASKFDIPVKIGDLLIHRKPLLKGLLQFREARIAGWNNAWNQDLTSSRVAQLEELDHTSGWDYFQMTWSEDRAHYQDFEALRKKGYPMLQIPAPVQYGIDLNEGLDGYLKSLSHNGRKSLKKKTRRGQALNPQLLSCDNADEIDAFFAEFFCHHIRYWDTKAGGSYFHATEERNFIVNWAKALYSSGQLRLERLLLNGETANMSIGIVSGNTFYWLLTINTGAYSDYAPGIIGLYLRLEQLVNQGVTRFNMGAGDYFYKIQSANMQTRCQDLLICNPRSLKGRLYFEWMLRKQRKMQDPALTIK